MRPPIYRAAPRRVAAVDRSQADAIWRRLIRFGAEGRVFGSHGRLERKLRQHGKAAMATVLSARVRLPALTLRTRINLGAMREETLSNPRWKMTVRAEPNGEPPFDAEICAWLEERPWVVPVLYDPSDHHKVVLDRAPEAQKAARQAGYVMRDRFVQENPPANPVDLLTKLIDLHNCGKLTDADFKDYKQKLYGGFIDLHRRGKLTDAEFEDYKQKLLGE